jgi:predicted dehydrogenase
MGQLAHLRHYAGRDDCAVVALAEVRPETARGVAQRFGIPAVYPSVTDMLAAEQLDGVVAAQPYERHAFMLPEIFAAAPNVLSEKPLANSVEHGARLVQAAKAAGTTHMVGYMKRCDPAVVRAREVIAAWRAGGQAGKLRYARVSMSAGEWLLRADTAHVDAGDPRPQDEMEPAPASVPGHLHERHSDLVNFYVHQLNLLRHLVGEPYELVHADPNGVLYVGRTASGVEVVLEAEPYGSKGWDETALVGFEGGYVKVDLPPPLAWEPGRLEVYDGDTTTVPQIEQRPAFERQAEAFVAVCRGEQAPPADGADALLDLQLIQSAIGLLS